MVRRKLNRPAVKVGTAPIYWLNELLVEWHCSKCFNKQGKGNIAFEMSYKRIPAGKLAKLYLCPECAISVLSEALEEVKSATEMGADAYRLLQDL